ncbi:MAG: cobalamin biosynthesis protein [Xanthobacteraceae bacterium]
MRTAAERLGLSLLIVPELELAAAGDRIQTRSERVMAVAGVGSVAEAAALAAAGPAGSLIVPRLVLGAATCALAASAPETTS